MPTRKRCTPNQEIEVLGRNYVRHSPSQLIEQSGPWFISSHFAFISFLFSALHDGDTLILGIAKGKVHVFCKYAC